MSSKETIIVPENEIAEQRLIIDRIRQNNELEHEKTGKTKKAFVITYGCQLNVNDSEKLKGMLRDMGYIDTDKKEDADIIIFNTCAVRENAELKVYGNIGALKHLKEENPELIIGICGCMMQQEHVVEHIKKKYRHVDMVFGTHTMHRFPAILDRVLNEKYTVIDILNTDGQIIEGLPIQRESKGRAWVTIMYGCNNFCSYCIVPYVRGRERSRTPEDILREVNELIADGCKEVTLLGQNVNSYGKDLENPIDFAELLKMVNAIEGLERLRFMTSHPKDISDKLIETMAQCDKVCEQLHLPFQSGSNRILKAMNRKYTREDYLEKIKKVKEKISGVSLSTDIIVGFPGETDDDFEETLDIVKQVGFDQIFMFIYSKRKGTPAAEMKEQVDKEKVKANFKRLTETQDGISKSINETYLGKVEELLVESVSKNNPEMLTGRTRGGKVVNFKGSKELIDTLVKVKITEAHSWFLIGEKIKGGQHWIF